MGGLCVLIGEVVPIPDFYEKPTVQSALKSRVVAKYFWAWAHVVLPTVSKRPSCKIKYMDLFAGPGRYQDGTPSTPLLVLEEAIKDESIGKRLGSLFNDVDPDVSEALIREIRGLPGIESLRHRPKVFNREVGEETVRYYETRSMEPTLCFIDPFGYRGLSLRLVGAIVKNWGCDCIFFFNYNRVNMGLGNKLVDERMNALFGKDRAEHLRPSLGPLSPTEREEAVVRELEAALKEVGGQFVRPFAFKNKQGKKSRHHLILVTKHPRGYEIMKEIMAVESSNNEQGVPTFQHSLSPDSFHKQLSLFGDVGPLDVLAGRLVEVFAGQTLTMQQVYEGHNVGTPYIAKNYRDALRQLEAESKIQVEPPAEKRQRRQGEVTFASDVRVTFHLPIPDSNPHLA
jgi:three-Cys-motif partner protein